MVGDQEKKRKRMKKAEQKEERNEKKKEVREIWKIFKKEQKEVVIKLGELLTNWLNSVDPLTFNAYLHSFTFHKLTVWSTRATCKKYARYFIVATLSILNLIQATIHELLVFVNGQKF